jgi:hypothetical protein
MIAAAWAAAFALAAALNSARALAQAPALRPDATRLVVLGVSHTAQLVSRTQQPAVLRAFFDRVAPAAIGIERDPESFARNDHYEFTYEIQEVVVPYARERGIALHPFDWMPPTSDQVLGFGIDLERPPFLRPATGFGAFLSFPDTAELDRPFFFADDRDHSTMAEVRAWQNAPAEPARADMARRLFLYRTFLQAQRIAAMASAHPGETVLVVVGAFHKQDLEDILAEDPRVELVQPSDFGLPTDNEVSAALRTEDLHAIAYFNLLGVQAGTGVVDWEWVREAVETLEETDPSPAVRLYRARLSVLTETTAPEDAAALYETLRDATPSQDRFVWTGVKDRRRVDSFFAPFGNLGVRDRAGIELARVFLASGREDEAEAVRAELLERLTPEQRQQLAGYWEPFVLETR